MKRVLMRYFIVPIILILSVAGCSGGGGSGGGASSGPHTPVLSGLNLYPNSSMQYAESGTIRVSFYLNFTDAGGDLSSMTVTIYDSNGAVLGSGTESFQGASGLTEGYIDGALSADTTKARNFKISFSVTDSAGAVSNVVEAMFTVIPVASLVSIEVTPANPTIEVAEQKHFTAVGTYDDTTTLDLTNMVNWTSSDENIATINSSGWATGQNRGSATITATMSAISGATVSGQTVLNVRRDFGPAIHYPCPGQYQDLGNTAIGDLNGDGKNDVAVFERWNSGPHIFVYFQNAGHTLDTAQVITTDLDLSGIAIADVNNDGLAELIVAGRTKTLPLEGRIYVYTQDAVTHSLGAPQTYAISVQTAYGLSVADLNNDGLPDIVVSGYGLVSILFQGQGGVLNSEVTYTSVPVYNDGELHVADMNNDGLNDIVLQSGPLQLAVIKQLSPGTFSTAPDYYSVSSNGFGRFNSFALGDLNNDGRTDIATVENADSGYLNILIQDKTGMFTGPTLTLPYSGGDEIHIADINGDGINEIIRLFEGDLVSILYQANDHSFPGDKASYLLPTISSGGTFVHQAMSIGDVTGDGLPDIVASWSNEGIFVLPRLP